MLTATAGARPVHMTSSRFNGSLCALALHCDAKPLPSNNYNPKPALYFISSCPPTFCREWRRFLCSNSCQPPESIFVNALLAAFYMAPIITSSSCVWQIIPLFQR